MTKENQSSLVSVIIPTYGGSDSLKDAVDSVLNQTHKNIEAIVVDDNPSNSTNRKKTEIIMDVFKNNKKVKYIKHKENKNGSAARNTGINNSNGKYIAFLDDDDCFFPNKIEKQIKCLEEKNGAFCCCYYIKDGKKFDFEPKDDYTKDVLMINKTPQTSSFFMKKSLALELNGFDESYPRHQDYEFLIRVCEKTKVLTIKEYLYERVGNIVENRPKADKMEFIKDKLLNDFSEVIIQKRLNKSKIYAKNYSYVYMLYLKEKKFNKAFGLLKKRFNFYFLYYFFQLVFNNLKIKFLKLIHIK